jgi:hypothetical protein
MQAPEITLEESVAELGVRGVEQRWGRTLPLV